MYQFLELVNLKVLFEPCSETKKGHLNIFK